MYGPRLLIGTETFHKAGAPHMVATVIEGSDYLDREMQYKDVVGYCKYEIEELNLEAYHEEMKNSVKSLNKNLVFILKRDNKLLGWLYYKNQDSIEFREIQVFTTNDVNYDLWLDPESSFWNPVDFLLEAEYFEHPMIEEEPEDSILDEKIDALTAKIEVLNSTVLQLAGVIKSLLKTIQIK